MKPVNQTIHTLPGGNCFQACVASVLELPLEKVPHFWKKAEEDLMLTQEHLDAPLRFASENGYLATWIDPKIEADFVKLLIESEFYYVACGPSHGGDWGLRRDVQKQAGSRSRFASRVFGRRFVAIVSDWLRSRRGRANVMSRLKLLDPVRRAHTSTTVDCSPGSMCRAGLLKTAKF